MTNLDTLSERTGGDTMTKKLSEIPFSVLDLAPIIEGGTAGEAFRNSLELAQHAENWGFHSLLGSRTP